MKRFATFMIWTALVLMAVVLSPFTALADVALHTTGVDILAPIVGLAGTIGVSADNPAVYGGGAYPQRGGASRTFIPQIWSGKMVEKFYATTVYGEIANTDYEGDITGMGDEVIVHNLPDATISDYEKGDTVDYEDLNASNTSLTIDYAKLFAFKLDDIDRIQASRKLMDDFTGEATKKMKISIDTTINGTIYAQSDADNQGNAAGAISGDYNLGSDATPLALDKTNVLDFIVDLRSVLEEQFVPDDGHWLLLPSKLSNIIKKSDLKDASMTGDGESLVRNGRLGMIDGTVLYRADTLAKVTGNWKIMSGTKSALTFASQFTEVQHFEKLERTFGQAIRGLNVFGFKVINPKALAVGTVSI